MAKLAKKVEVKKKTRAAPSSTIGVVIKDRESSKVAPSSTKGVVIREKMAQGRSSQHLAHQKGKVDDLKGGAIA